MHQGMQETNNFFPPPFGGAKLKFFIDFFLISFAFLGAFFLFVSTDSEDQIEKLVLAWKFLTRFTRISKAIIRFESASFEGWPSK
jgi:hypothetical protein